MESFLTGALTAVAIPLIYWWLARKYPAPELSTDGPTMEELAPKYRKWEVLSTLAYIVLWFPISAAVFAPLHLVARWRAEGMAKDADTFVFFMDGAALWLPAFFMALLLSVYVLTPALKAILKSRYAEYERYAALKFGFDQNRVMKGLGVTISAAFVVAVLALFDTYVIASPRDLRVNPLFGLERRYPYGEVTEIVTAPALIAPNGDTVYRRVHVVKFKDGTSYTTDNMPEDEIRARPRSSLVHAIIERSGARVTEKPIFERGEL